MGRVHQILAAISSLKYARTQLRIAQAPYAKLAVDRALKSAAGALRHAEGEDSRRPRARKVRKVTLRRDWRQRP